MNSKLYPIHTEFLHRWNRYKTFFNLASTLQANGVEKICIFGGAVFGELLFEELFDSGIHIDYIIDDTPSLKFRYDAQVISTDDITSDYRCDMIIVTAIYNYGKVYKNLSEKTSIPIESLANLIIDVDEYIFFDRLYKNAQLSNFHIAIFDISMTLWKIRNPSLHELYTQAIDNKHNITDVLKLENQIFSILKSFYSDIEYCSKDYVKQLTEQYIPQIVYCNDRLQLANKKSKYFNVIENCRVTTDSPYEYDYAIHFFGQCVSAGVGTEDSKTIQSVLQKRINSQFTKKIKILNHSNWHKGVELFKQAINTTIAPGDLAILLARDLRKH